MTADELKGHMETFFTQEGVPATEFDFDFVIKMMRLMQISYFKYGTLSQAYPFKYVAHKDVLARQNQYMHTGNLWYMADVANFAMIEAKHPDPDRKPFWGPNDAADSPGRVSTKGKLVTETNEGDKL